MIEIRDSITDAGGSVNEDRIGHARFTSGAAAAWVIDGATGVGEREWIAGTGAAPHAGTDAAWFAERLSRLLAERDPAGAEPRRYFEDLINVLRAEYGHAVPHFETLPPWTMPSATATWLRATPVGLELAWQGDCTAVIMQDGRTQVIGAGLDRIWDQQIDDIVKERHLTVRDDKARIADMIAVLRERRSLLNQPDGYWMVGIEPRAASAMTVETVPLDGPAKVLLVSDGLWRLVEIFGLYDAAGLVQAAEHNGLATLVNELRGIEADDGDGTRFPRVKLRDDASGLFFTMR